ncbi:U7 snRNA-associated Sm-like protein LSm11 [Pseudomyrmex gracilis]|uniref:U7 snRNA-associated Sm-like protein LSm11 n=1 Tax=Pseudomyrmex gracilis TaxID=219809 RepID=UPI000994DF88|nr:U7 snRNA-associated Sm-like protein LSm11 [Pseudomyrmex gracilis]
MADDSSETSDESLDATSERFDPLKALYSTKVLRLLPSAPTYDNVSKFESVLKGVSGSTKSCGKSVEPVAGSSRRREVLPYKEPTSGRGYEQSRNVISRMQKIVGPLGMLYGCMENKIRVRVYTRNERGIRGHVEAYVAAFDKHWNLALEDCFEVWSRKIKRKAPALGYTDAIEVTTTKQNVPRIMVRKIERKTETLERHVPQMLLRGEQIAIIVKIN